MRGRRTNHRADATNEEENPPIVENQNLAALLQGLERVARIAMETEQRRPREVDPFFECYRSFTSLHPPTFDGTGDFAVAEN